MKVYNSKFSALRYLAAAMLMAFVGSSCEEPAKLFTDDEYPSPVFLYVTVEETNFDVNDTETATVTVNVESTGVYAWTATSNAEWCVVPDVEYAGSGTIELQITEVNRTDNDRSATISLTLVTDYSTVTDNFTVTQTAFPYAALSIGETFESSVWADEGEVELELSYNNSITVEVNYLTEGESDWITLPEEPLEELFGSANTTLDYIFTYSEYTADPGSTRVAEVVFTNNVLHGETGEVVQYTYTLTQSVEAISKDPAVTSFSDNFNYITANGGTYDPTVYSMGWTTSEDLKEYYASALNWTNILMYQALADASYTKWLIAPAVNPAGATTKSLSFWFSGANVNSDDPNARLEVVYTTDAVGSDLNAPEWITIGEVDYSSLSAWGTKKLYEVVFDGTANGTDGDEYRTALDAFAKESWVMVGLRYTSGGKMGYRVDDFRFGIEAASTADTAE